MIDSGHGGQLDNLNQVDDPEVDGKDEGTYPVYIFSLHTNVLTLRHQSSIQSMCCTTNRKIWPLKTTSLTM